jgi:sigma-B regulation protein RsbU (phosphoserine phosphatase)
MYYGSAKSDVMVLQRNGNLFIYALVPGSTKDFNIYPLNTTTLTSYGSSIKHLVNFETLQRPWYKAGNNGTLRWSETFLPVSPPYALTVAASVPISNSYYLPDIVNPGVLSVGFSLDSLTQFLGRIDVHPTTKIFIIERSGYLVGVRGGQPYEMRNVSGSLIPVKLLAEDYGDQVIRSTVKAMNKRFSDFDMKDYEQFQFIDSLGQGRTVAISPLSDPNGIDWLIVTVLAKKVTMKTAKTASIVSAVISVVAIAVAVLLSFLLGLIVTYPLKRLSREMRRIANMEFKESSFRKQRLSLVEFHEVCIIGLFCHNYCVNSL